MLGTPVAVEKTSQYLFEVERKCKAVSLLQFRSCRIAKQVSVLRKDVRPASARGVIVTKVEENFT